MKQKYVTGDYYISLFIYIRVFFYNKFVEIRKWIFTEDLIYEWVK